MQSESTFYFSNYNIIKKWAVGKNKSYSEKEMKQTMSIQYGRGENTIRKAIKNEPLDSSLLWRQSEWIIFFPREHKVISVLTNNRRWNGDVK